MKYSQMQQSEVIPRVQHVSVSLGIVLGLGSGVFRGSGLFRGLVNV